jgi:hypothetical protein
MSTEQTQQHRTTTPGRPDSPAQSTGRLDLSPTKIIGGALAAMTAAALGSQLSVVGTVVGAAVASVVAAVAGTLYTASLERTGTHVRRVWRRGDAPVLVSTPVLESVQAAPLPKLRPTRHRLSWSSVLVGALAAFGLAAVALTGIELVTGHALSGGDGTTVSQVSGGNDGAPEEPADRPSPTPTSESTDAEPTTTPSEETSPSEPTTPAPTVDPTVAPSTPVPTETETAPSTTPNPTGSKTVTTAP